MSSPIAHTAIAYAVYNIFRRQLPAETVCGIPARIGWPLAVIILCMLPDLDTLVAWTFGSLERFHNNLSHSLLIGAMAPLLLAPLLRIVTKISMKTTLRLILACGFSHILIDLFTMGRGVMLFWPWTSIRFHAPISLFVGVPWSSKLTSPLYFLSAVNDLCFAVAIVALVKAVHLHSDKVRDNTVSL